MDKNKSNTQDDIYWNFTLIQNFKVPSSTLDALLQPVLDLFSFLCLLFRWDKVSFAGKQLSDGITDWCLC